MNNPQEQRDRVCDRFLTSQAFAGALCDEFGLAELAECLVFMLCNLQSAHERLVCRNANRMLLQIVKGIQAKVITPERARRLFELDEAALAALVNRLDKTPKQDLVDYLSGLKELKKPGARRRRTGL